MGSVAAVEASYWTRANAEERVSAWRTFVMLAILVVVMSACSGTQGGSASRTEAPTSGITTDQGLSDGDATSETPVTPCTAAGCFSGVDFDISRLQGREQPVTIEACVNDVCKTATYPVEENLPQNLFVELEEDEVDAGAVVHARLVATGPDAQVIADHRWERVPLDEQLQPNGPSCPPTCWVGNVRLEA